MKTYNEFCFEFDNPDELDGKSVTIKFKKIRDNLFKLDVGSESDTFELIRTLAAHLDDDNKKIYNGGMRALFRVMKIAVTSDACKREVAEALVLQKQESTLEINKLKEEKSASDLRVKELESELKKYKD